MLGATSSIQRSVEVLRRDQGPHTKKAIDLRMVSKRETTGKLGFQPREPSAFAGSRATFQAAVNAEGDRAPRRLSTAIMTFQACLAGSASTRADVCPEMSAYRGHRFCFLGLFRRFTPQSEILRPRQFASACLSNYVCTLYPVNQASVARRFLGMPLLLLLLPLNVRLQQAEYSGIM